MNYRFAVATKSGILVDEHFGHIESVEIYDYKAGEVVYVENRVIEKYCTGDDTQDHDDKINRIIKTISDCQCVLVLRIGQPPIQKLAAKGICVYCTYDRIIDAVKEAALSMEKSS